jgi:hypothetical protein
MRGSMSAGWKVFSSMGVSAFLRWIKGKRGGGTPPLRPLSTIGGA